MAPTVQTSYIHPMQKHKRDKNSVNDTHMHACPFAPAIKPPNIQNPNILVDISKNKLIILRQITEIRNIVTTFELRFICFGR